MAVNGFQNCTSVRQREYPTAWRPFMYGQNYEVATTKEQEEELTLSRFLFPSRYGIPGCSFEEEVPPEKKWWINDPVTEFLPKYFPETPIVLSRFPAHLALKVAQKLDAVSFSRMMRTGTYMKNLTEQRNSFNIILPHTLTLRGHGHYNIDRLVSVYKDRSKSVLYDIRDPEIKLQESQWNTVRFFSFDQIIVKCDVELYHLFKPWLAGKNVGCIYEQNSWCPYDYISMFRPRKLRVSNIDTALYEIIKDMDVEKITCNAGVDPVVNTDAVPHMAKIIKYQCLDKNPLAAKFSQHLINYLNNTYIGKMKELHITTTMTFDEIMPKKLQEMGQVWSGSMVRCLTHRVENRPVCAMFRTVDKRYALVFGLETVMYTFALDIQNEQQVIELLRSYPFMFNENLGFEEPLLVFINNFMSI